MDTHYHSDAIDIRELFPTLMNKKLLTQARIYNRRALSTGLVQIVIYISADIQVNPPGVSIGQVSCSTKAIIKLLFLVCAVPAFSMIATSFLLYSERSMSDSIHHFFN